MHASHAGTNLHTKVRTPRLKQSQGRCLRLLMMGTYNNWQVTNSPFHWIKKPFLCRLDIVYLTVKEEKGHGKRRENKTDKRDHDGGKVLRGEVFSDVACVRWDISSLCENRVDAYRHKEASCRCDGWKELLGDGVEFGRGSIIRGLGRQLRFRNRRRRNRLEAVGCLQTDKESGQSSKQFHLNTIYGYTGMTVTSGDVTLMYILVWTRRRKQDICFGRGHHRTSSSRGCSLTKITGTVVFDRQKILQL